MDNAIPTAPTVGADQQTLILPRRLAVQLLHHAQLSPEHEVCGLVAARQGQPVRFFAIDNVADDPAHSFEMDESGLIRAMTAIREQGLTLWAIFHSHPTAAAEPSVRDLQEGAYPEALHLIASLNIKGVLELRAWRRQGSQVVEQTLGVRD